MEKRRQPDQFAEDGPGSLIHNDFPTAAHMPRIVTNFARKASQNPSPQFYGKGFL